MNTAPDVRSEIDEALAAAETRYAAANPGSRARHERATGVLPAGHSRQTLYFSPFPLTIEKGKGCRVTDIDGHEYLNLVGDYAAGLFGHQSEALQRAVIEAMQSGISLSGPNTREVEFAEYISRRIPSMEQLRFCNSGSEACLFATLIARHATRRPRILVFNGCYHGGFMIYGPKDPALSVPFATIKSEYNDIEGTRAVLRANATDIAAVLVEPVMGSGGAIVATPEFLAMLRQETRALGIVLIFDEVMTSRMGPGGVQGLRGIRPDLTTLGKFWGGGFAFGAFGGSRELMCHLDMRSGGLLSQAGTFNNNVVTMTAGLVGARDVYSPQNCVKLNALGDRLREQLCEVGRSLKAPFQVTGLGGVMNSHWSSGIISSPRQVLPANAPLRRLFQLELIERGYYVAQRGMINLSLPMLETDLSGFVNAVREFLVRHSNILPRS
ncbi:MAG: aminotransferase class III-fold pyridoxal phosphate-dependent enzyme [Proteobacteria bacterium]|nr:aminotransferase class III-fold pyridoxal phosphate-dependent enzyme [Pseudomonadota bacterium]